MKPALQWVRRWTLCNQRGLTIVQSTDEPRHSSDPRWTHLTWCRTRAEWDSIFSDHILLCGSCGRYFCERALGGTFRCQPSRASCQLSLILLVFCQVVDVFWVSPNEGEKSVARVEPNKQKTVGSFPNHVFRVRDSQVGLAQGCCMLVL